MISAALRPPLLALLVGIAIGWAINGWRLGADLSALRADHAQQLERIAAAQAAAIAEQQQIRDQLEKQLAAIDHQRYQELTHAQENSDRLAADLATARQRLRVRIDPASCGGVPDTSGTAGVDDGAGAQADLHPATAAGVVRVTGRADQCRARLMALQEWVMEVSKRGD
ncbi:lysis protein [Pseudomonas sp. MAP12]|uniref:Lysis protein n=1 Tax=Geopseudomonas aromaticivorans TaxID=2849492 RepID=A0ABS6MTC3_9GAMM|nr:lysis protein [Pseudomonas aromaticivorans]